MEKRKKGRKEENHALLVILQKSKYHTYPELLLKRDNGSQVNATSWSSISTPLTELLSHCAEVNSNQKLILQCVKVR